jgi:hypothetical protein
VLQEKARLEFEKRRAEAEAAADAKTAKNRARRMKKKDRGRKGGGGEGGDDKAEPDREDVSEKPAKKQKLGGSGDAVVVFRSAKERGVESEDEDDREGSGVPDDREPAQQNTAVEEPSVEEIESVRRAEERGISIVDDD